jgi:hypothetical protein
MNENAQLNLQKSLGDVSTNMRGNDYESQKNLFMQDRAQNLQNYQWDQGFNRDLFNDAYTQNMGNLQAGVGLLGTMAGYNANDLTNGTNIQNTPLNYWSQFSNSDGWPRWCSVGTLSVGQQQLEPEHLDGKR